LLELHQRAMPVPMREKRPDLAIPEELDKIVLGCLAKRAAQRPTNAHELELRLAQLPSERPVVSVVPRGSRLIAKALPDGSSHSPIPTVPKQRMG